MSNLSQFYGSNSDSIELELWVVGGGGGGGARGYTGTAGGGGGGGIYYDHVTVPRGSTMSFVIGAGGAGGSWLPATNFVYGGVAGGRSYVQIYKDNIFAKTYSAAGGGYGGWGGGYNSEGGDGGCGGGAGIGGNFNSLDPGITYSAYKTNSTFTPPNTSVPFRSTGRSYYTLKDSYWSVSSANTTYNPQPNKLKTGYYGSDASVQFSGQGGGVLMPIPGLLDVSTPGYYSTTALWGWTYNPHNDIPIVSIPGGSNNSPYSQFLGYANTGNGGNGGAPQSSGNSGSSGFIFFRYPYQFNSATYSDSDIRDVSFSNIYNYSSGYRAYIVTGTATLTLPTS